VVDDSNVVFGQKFPCEKKKWEMGSCQDATASSFAAKVLGKVIEHFQAVAEKTSQQYV
jgi:hypothetical protein